MYSRCLLIKVAAVLVFVDLAGAATTWYVPSQYPTIQSAINSTQVVDGDVIFLEEGTYYTQEHGTPTTGQQNSYSIVINKNITLTSEDRETAIIDGNDLATNDDGYGSVIVVTSEGQGCVISNLTIQNGRAHDISCIDFYSSPLCLDKNVNKGGGICGIKENGYNPYFECC